MTPLIFVAVVTYFVIFQCISCRSEDTTSSYSCCPTPQIRFNQRCEHQWIIDGMTIARVQGEKKEFMSPCKDVKDDLMLLEQCVDVNVTVTCVNNGLAVEERIRYHGDPCPNGSTGNIAPGNQGCVPLLLLAALVLMLVR